MRHTIAVAVSGLAVLLGLTGAAAAQQALPADQALSANVQNLVNNNLPAAPFLTAMAASGWTGARGDAFWFRAEPSQGTYDWSYFDGLKDKYEAGGVRWQPILEGSPAWARPGSTNVLALPSPDHVADFAAFAAAFAQRYGPGGPKAGALPVTDIELYNEQNTPGAGAYTADPASYADLYRQARAAIHAQQPGIRVIIGALLYDSEPPTDADYIKGMFAALNGSGADAIALHPYAPTAIGVAANLRRMQQGLVDAGQAGLPIYVNELGYAAALDGATPQRHAALGPTTDEARAGTVTLLTDALLASDCSIRNVAYFDLVNQENNKADTDYLSSETWKGLERRADGSLTVTGAGFRDAGARWRANPVPGSVHVCGADAAPQTAPVGLELQVERPSALCLRPTVTYRGFPVEEATVQIRKVDLKQGSPVLTDAAGRLEKDFCVDDPTTYLLQAEVSYAPAGVPRFAQSVALTCRLGTSAPCAVVPNSGPGGGPAAPGGGAGANGLSAAAGCLLKSFRVVGSKKLATVLRNGLRLRATGCRAVGADAATRSVRVTATIERRLARRLGLARRLPAAAFAVGKGTRQLKGAADATIVVRFTAAARAKLRATRRVKVGLGVQLTEGAQKRSVSRSVTLVR
jgi:hypothetical protein